MVEYKVKKNKAPVVRKAIKEFVARVRRKEGWTLVYEAFEKPDGVSFVHFMVFKNEKAEEFHRTTPHCAKFVSILYPNCVKKPVFTEIKLVAYT